MLTSNNLKFYYVIPMDTKASADYGKETICFINNENQQPNLEDLTENLEVCNNGSIKQFVEHQTTVQKTETQTNESCVLPLPEAAESKYTCPKCEHTFKTIKEYKHHLKWHKSQKKFKCNLCSMGYNNEVNLKIHNELTHTTGSNLKSCPICGVSLKFKRTAGLKSHLMVHQTEEVQSCEECDAEFEKEDEYAQHMATHSTQNKECSSLTCSHCELQFQTKNQLRIHISNHIKALKGFRKRKTKKPNSKEKPYTAYSCKVCKKSFIKQSLLLRHQMIHSGEKPFKCSVCDQSFIQKGTLQVHLLTHTGLKPFSCTLCPAKFNQKGNLRVHLKKTHTVPYGGQKTFKCPHCSCIFKKVASLNGHVTKAHLRSNQNEENIINNVMKNLKDLEENNVDHYVTLTESISGDVEKKYSVQLKRIGDVKWYRCMHCTKMCKKPSDLIKHIRVHTKEKPFECKTCKKRFTLKCTLLSHMDRKHQIEKLKCDICDITFSTTQSRIAHLKKHTNDNFTQLESTVDDIANTSKQEVVQDSLNKRQVIINKMLKQPLFQTVYGTLTFKPPRSKRYTDSELSLTKPFQCSTCHVRFTRRYDLNRHIKEHVGDKQFKCNICSKTFVASYRLREHMNYHNKIKNYPCEQCNKRFFNSSHLRRHMITHSNLRPYTCPYCYKNFQTLSLTRRHIKLVHKKDALAELASKETEKEVVATLPLTSSVIINNVSKLKNVTINSQSSHQDLGPEEPSLYPQVISTDPGIESNVGLQTFYVSLDDFQLINNAVNLNSLNDVVPNSGNVATGSPQKENQVDSNLIFTNPENTNITTSTTPETILDANTVFPSSSNLNEVKGVFEDASIICMHCNQVYTSLTHFQKHLCTNNPDQDTNKNSNVETKEIKEEPKEDTNFVYINNSSNVLQSNGDYKTLQNNSVQEKQISNLSLLENNDSIDNISQLKSLPQNGKTSCYPCVFCTKSFKKASDLERHHRTHTGEKPFTCDICNKNFSLKATLNSHLNTHDPNPKQFCCGICNCLYSSKASLKVHMTLHTGAMPYKCTICNMDFRTLGAKKSHEGNGNCAIDKKKSTRKNKLADFIKNTTTEIATNNDNKDEIPKSINTLPEYINFENLGLVMDSNNVSQTQTLDIPSQIVSLSIPPTIISTIPENQINVDSTNLLQQLQMSDMVLTTNETGAVPSLIMDDVSFLDLNTTTNNLQIISLPENDGAGVTISIQESNIGLQTETKPRKPKVPCDLCFKMLGSKHSLKRHKKNIHGDKKKTTVTK